MLQAEKLQSALKSHGLAVSAVSNTSNSSAGSRPLPVPPTNSKGAMAARPLPGVPSPLNVQDSVDESYEECTQIESVQRQFNVR